MKFLTEPPPAFGEAMAGAPGVRRIVAGNPGPMTYHGTNTYLFEAGGGFLVLDPGPNDPDHIAAVIGAAQGRVSHILVTHAHTDHAAAAPALRDATGAATAGYAGDRGFAPEIELHDGDTIAGLLAIHTPGHAADHLCFAHTDGLLFSGDHVMSWSSSVISPPDGDMAAYLASLERLLRREDRLYLAGHGPPLAHPQRLVAQLLGHRLAREAAIATALAAQGPAGAMQLVDRIYGRLDRQLRTAAERNVVAHLHKLRNEGRASELPDGRWQAV